MQSLVAIDNARVSANAAVCGRQMPLVLVVDDDAGMVQLLRTLLWRMGFGRVLSATDPYAALSLARESGCAVDLLISDIDLGTKMDGVQLARELVARSPAAKVVLMSGDHTREHGLPGDWSFLPKPFALADLLALLQKSLGGQRLRAGAA